MSIDIKVVVTCSPPRSMTTLVLCIFPGFLYQAWLASHKWVLNTIRVWHAITGSLCQCISLLIVKTYLTGLSLSIIFFFLNDAQFQILSLEVVTFYKVIAVCSCCARSGINIPGKLLVNSQELFTKI